MWPRAIRAGTDRRPASRAARSVIIPGHIPVTMTNMQQAVTSSDEQDRGSNVALERELAGMIVEALNLEVQPDEITAAAPLYGEGLGLDSIDILEVALVVSKKYGFQLRSDDENNVRIFQSLGTLAAHIAAHRTK